jgi:hypothetical protein
VVAGTSALLAVLLAATTAVGSPDDLGRAGRSLLRQCSAVQSTAVGPWPGSYYTVPVAVTVGVGLVLAGWALRRVARRPLDATDAAVDGALRRASATAVAAAAGLLVAAPAAAVSVVAAAALAGVDCAPAGWSALALLLALVAVAGTGLSAWTAGVLLRSTVPAAAPGEPVVR